MKEIVNSTIAILKQHKEKSDRVEALKDALYKLHPVGRDEYPDSYWCNDQRESVKAVYALYIKANKDLDDFEITKWTLQETNIRTIIIHR